MNVALSFPCRHLGLDGVLIIRLQQDGCDLVSNNALQIMRLRSMETIFAKIGYALVAIRVG